MVKQTGIQNERTLHRMARISYKNAHSKDRLKSVTPERPYLHDIDVQIQNMNCSYHNPAFLSDNDIETTYL